MKERTNAHAVSFDDLGPEDAHSGDAEWLCRSLVIALTHSDEPTEILLD